MEADLIRGHGGNDLDELGEVGLDQGAALGRHHPLCTNSLHHTNLAHLAVVANTDTMSFTTDGVFPNTVQDGASYSTCSMSCYWDFHAEE